MNVHGSGHCSCGCDEACDCCELVHVLLPTFYQCVKTSGPVLRVDTENLNIHLNHGNASQLQVFIATQYNHHTESIKKRPGSRPAAFIFNLNQSQYYRRRRPATIPPRPKSASELGAGITFQVPINVAPETSSSSVPMYTPPAVLPASIAAY